MKMCWKDLITLPQGKQEASSSAASNSKVNKKNYQIVKILVLYMVWSNSIFQNVYEIKAVNTLCPVKQTLLRIKNLIKAIHIVVNFKHH